MKKFIKDYNASIDWNVGSLFAHDDFLMETLETFDDMKLTVPIRYVFGSIPCLFQGGRVAPRTTDTENAFKIIDRYNQRGIGCRFTFSSHLITESDLEDTLCNELLSFLNNNMIISNDNIKNGVIVTSDLLAKYIKSKYKNLEIISSVVKPSIELGLGKDGVEYYNKLFDLYDIVVVNSSKIEDGNFLNDIKFKDRVEFIVNHRCLPNCPLAKKHYELVAELSKQALNNEDTDKTLNELANVFDICKKNRKRYPFLGDTYSYLDIEMLAQMGFKHFKLEGRDNSEVSFARDLGDYIFESNTFLMVVQSIKNMAF